MYTGSYLSEEEVEKKLIRILGEEQNQWRFRSDLKSEEELWQNLRGIIDRNNIAALEGDVLTDTEFERVKTELLSQTATPFQAAKWLRGEKGIARIDIERDDNTQVSLILYSNHEVATGFSVYEVVRQISKQNNHNIEGRDRRFDVTLLINGLPVVQIELKQVNAKDGIYQAYKQIKKYAKEGMYKNNIFSTLQLFVVSNERTTRYIANAEPDDLHRKNLFSWRTSDNIKVDDLYEFAKQFLRIPDAHRLLVDYMILSEDQSQKNLMVLHPYQIHAIKKLFQAASENRSGYVWHATGSGKTLTCFVSTKLLARANGVSRTIMLVDRKDLDNQTTTEFTKFASEYNTGDSTGKGKANTLIVGTGSATELAQTLLADENNNVIIITTRQKLEAALKHAEKQEKANGKNRFEKLRNQSIIFIVDECHRALSAENMEEMKRFFKKSTWFGFTGTPIFDVNKKQAKGRLPRTTPDQYGDVLHTYTIKNALEDRAVLGFQVEHETTIQTVSLENCIFKQLRSDPRNAKLSDEALNQEIDNMDDVTKESYLQPELFEEDEHIQEVIRKIFRPDNAYVKFDFKNGKSTKSAILTTSSIKMAKRYYQAIKELTADEDWMQQTFPKQVIREGRVINDSDFPRIAITYSVDENKQEAQDQQDDMQAIMNDYNHYYDTAWTLSNIDQYNRDINNRLARKQAEFQQENKQIDLVIVVDRLLTGFDAPTIQTLFVDRHLEYAGLIQAFSRTNRTYPKKEKGLIVTFRKPATMKVNVDEAIKLYSNNDQETQLVYPEYPEIKKKFNKAHKQLQEFLNEKGEIDENSSSENRVTYVKYVQDLTNAFEALGTYDQYNDEIVTSKTLQEKVQVLSEQMGYYQTVKGSLEDDISDKLITPDIDYSAIEFFSESEANGYDIDTEYINQLLGLYAANNKDLRNQIEDVLRKLKKSEVVMAVYRQILDDIDHGIVAPSADIFQVKRKYFTRAKDHYMTEFVEEWFVSMEELSISLIQYRPGMEQLPNIKAIMNSGKHELYKEKHPDSKNFKYKQSIKRAWAEWLEKELLPLEDELS